MKTGWEQQLIVTYSIKYRDYLQGIRSSQVERAHNAVAREAANVERKRLNDPNRFIKTDHATKDGEAADKKACYIDEEAKTKKQRVEDVKNLENSS